ncbi:heterokaryon incompatibility protein [Apiospora arundinis]|uniref:Heterokaryon incompatibility protein n=1 Tax=Apiospora arundinis TaxID=335852 RepID=A0ABR2IRH6_9PEZI
MFQDKLRSVCFINHPESELQYGHFCDSSIPLRHHKALSEGQLTFATWAKGVKWHDKIRNTPHPFGKSRNKVELEHDTSNPDVPLKEVRNSDWEVAERAGIVTSAAAAGAATQAAAQEQDKGLKTVLSVLGSGGLAFTSALAIMQKELPAVVVVTVHNIPDPDRGLLNIALMGYGNKKEVQAPLSILSSFNLRVASDYQDDGLGLRYGKMISVEVNVEDDCRKWLDHCCQHHGKLCEEPDWSSKLRRPSGKDFRMIEIGDEDDMFRVFHVNTDDQESSWKEKYAALSYVWGDAGKEALNLHSHNIKDLSERIPPEGVAKTISDAIKVTRRLGLRYLWVDSLCIIQKPRAGDGDSDASQTQADESKEFEQMSIIYGHASVVIIATGGEDAQAGLAGVSRPREPVQVAREVRPGVNVLLPIQYDKSYGRWDTRAWTLQEKLLSKRMLVFGKDHVAFHCRHGILREDMPADHARNGPAPMPHLSMPESHGHPQDKMTWDDKPIMFRSPFFDEYAKLMEQYTSRERTDSGDILKAVSGLLAVLDDMRSLDPEGEETSEAKSLYGLPEDFLGLALLWQPPAVLGTHLTKRTQEDYPSWSWAGWEVSKSPSHVQTDGDTHRVHPGVRFEEPFWVSGNDDLSLRKFVATGDDAEERFRPCVKWYRCQNPPPEPGRSLGLKLPPNKPRKPSNLIGTSKIDYEPRFRTRPPSYLEKPQATLSAAGTMSPSSGLELVNDKGSGVPVKNGVSGVPVKNGVSGVPVKNGVSGVPMKNGVSDVPVNNEGSGKKSVPSMRPGIPLDNRHLVCETQAARFRLRQKEKKPRKEKLWKLVDGKAVVAKELEILEAEILNGSDEVVGYVIPTDQGKTIATHPYDFIVLSESQYWGNEKRIDVMDFPLYNVMVVVWDTMGVFAERFGVGKISKSAWAKGNPSERCVALK